MADKKAIFLDRDGTINIDKSYLYKISDFEYLDGVIEALNTLSSMGFIMVVVTNQSGIARGYYTEEEYQILDKWMKEDLQNKGINIAASYFCPHLPDGVVPEYSIDCDCRKPKTGLFYKAANDLDIDLTRSYAIGDKLRDLSICKESAVKGILLSDEDNTSYEDISVCRNWKEIVDTITTFESK